MKNPIRSILGLAAIFAIVLSTLLFLAPSLHAADTAAASTAAATDAGDQITAAVASFLAGHTWLSTALAAFGALTVAYQALIAWAHQRAAATADDADDKWLASLEAKTWFRVLDRVFYWGGYIGAKLGGRKL